MSKAEIEATMLELMQSWPLYDPSYSLFAIGLESGDWSLGYCSPRPRMPWGTYWDANIIKGVFYLLHIQIAKKHRGNGYGNALYQILESIAWDLRCPQIRQHPSGNTSTGESRRDYLLRRGWIGAGVEVYKPFPEEPQSA